MKCPSCSSSNTQPAHIIHAQGTRNSRSSFGGVSISNRGRISIGSGRGHSTSQSRFAAAYAPPNNKGISPFISALCAFLICYTIISVIIVGAFPQYGFLSDSLIGKFINLTVVCFSVYLARKQYIKEKVKKSNNDNEYSHLWVCKRCGCNFRDGFGGNFNNESVASSENGSMFSNTMKEKLILVALWFFGILFIIQGFIVLSQSFLGSMFSILAGIALLPIVHQKIRLYLNNNIPTAWFICACFVLIIISGFSMQASEKRALENGTARLEQVKQVAN